MLPTILLLFNLGAGEITIILFLILLLFGGRKLPELARGLGKGIREFKDAASGAKKEIESELNSLDEEKKD